MNNLPTGTVTFLFTDIEGSTKLAQSHPDKWESLRERHHAILQTAMDAHNGYVFQIIGDAFCVAFHTATDALRAAIKSQNDLLKEDWSDTPIKVRIGLNTGVAQAGNSDDHSGGYTGYAALARVQRVMSIGYGGQILLSNTSAELVRGELPDHVSLRDMGEHRLKGLLNPEHLWQINAPRLPQEFPPLQSLNVIPTNLPVQLTTFVGREKEIQEVKDELGKHRLVTLTGSGGTGKTRLCLQVAADLLDSFSEGVWFIELASLSDPELIPSTILSTLGIREQPGRPALKVLEEFLATRKLLIMLDNCEHLIAEAAKVTNAILNAAPNLKILASSREALGVKGELSWHVPSLSLPDPKHNTDIDGLTQYEAVRLFIDRASLVDSHFTVTKDNAPAIAQICYRLDGIPLALELAAARVKLLSVEQISARLDDRFRLLTGGARTAVPRQQTLRSMIDWSYDLLSDSEKLLLHRLAAFAGGWTLEIAEQVCSNEKIHQHEILELLGKLVDKSLVAVIQNKSGKRYRILETVRQYAREKLFESGESEKIRDQHLKAFVDLAEQAEPEIRGANQLIWLDRLDEEIDNLRAALEWSQVRDLESCLRLTGALWRFWDMRSYNADALEWFDQSIKLSNGMRTIPRARLLSRASVFYRNMAKNKKPLQLAREASVLARELNDKASLVLALGIEGEAVLDQPEIAQPLLEEALRISEELDDHWLVSVNLYDLANLAHRRSDYELQRSCLEKGLEEGRLSGDHRRVSNGLGYLSFYYVDRGKFSQAEEILIEGLAVATQIGDMGTVAERSLNLANVNIFLEKYSEAEALLLESRKAIEEVGDNDYLVFVLCGLGFLAWVKEDIEQFAELTSKALKIAKQVDSLYALAHALMHHGYAALFNNEYQLAREELSEGIRACQKMNVNRHYGWGIASFGMLAAAEGQLERAAQIFGAHEGLTPSLPAETPFLIRKIHEQMELAKNKLGNELFEASAPKGKLMSLEQALAFVLDESYE